MQKLQRQDMVGIVDFFHRKRSRLASQSITEYRPREAHAIADHLAGCVVSCLWSQFETKQPCSIQPKKSHYRDDARSNGPKKSGVPWKSRPELTYLGGEFGGNRKGRQRDEVLRCDSGQSSRYDRTKIPHRSL